MPRTTARSVCLALWALSLVLFASASENAPGADINGLYSEYVEKGGKKYEVADPIEDPRESASLAQDSTAEWQQEMVAGLMKQRKAEKAFIDKLEIGGKTLEEMVKKITSAFMELNSARQKQGRKLIEEHFTGEIRLLKKSQEETIRDLAKVLSESPTDSEELKALKSQISKTVNSNFAKSLKDHKKLYDKQIKEIEENHKAQTVHVRRLFKLIDQWKTTFRLGLKKSAQNLEEISESWDMI